PRPGERRPLLQTARQALATGLELLLPKPAHRQQVLGAVVVGLVAEDERQRPGRLAVLLLAEEVQPVEEAVGGQPNRRSLCRLGGTMRRILLTQRGEVAGATKEPAARCRTTGQHPLGAINQRQRLAEAAAQAFGRFAGPG